MSTTAREAILELIRERGPEKSACPSEAARRLAGEHWRAAMDDIHKAAASLQREGRLRVTQRGEPVDLISARGPVRLSEPRR
jgi:predicted Zn-ribbon and HTH transcriptional regulator